MDYLVKALVGYEVRSDEDVVGHVTDFLFCPDAWRLRYLEVAIPTKGKRRYLLPISAAAAPSEERRRIPIVLTLGEIADCPWVDPDRPLSGAKEHILYEHYCWAPYWPQGQSSCGAGLIKLSHVTDFRVETADGIVGRVDDLLTQTDDWAIDALVVRARGKPATRARRIATAMVQEIDRAGFRIMLRGAAGRPEAEDRAKTVPSKTSTAGSAA